MMEEPTTKQLEYLQKITRQIGDWNEPQPITKAEASKQIDLAKKMWAIEHSGDIGDIF